MTTKPQKTPRAGEYDYDRLMEMYPSTAYFKDLVIEDHISSQDRMQQEPHYTQTATILRHRYHDRRDVLISVDNFVYYEENNPRSKLAPDIMVAFDVDPDEVVKPDSYLMWIVGRPPDFVMEVASKSTWRNDLGSKRDLYARIGVPELCLLDPTGGDFYGETLTLETLVDGEYRRSETRTGDNGALMWHSVKLSLWLYFEDEQLRFYDPVQGRRLNTFTEEVEAHEVELQARLDAEAEIVRLREMLRHQSG